MCRNLLRQSTEGWCLTIVTGSLQRIGAHWRSVADCGVQPPSLAVYGGLVFNHLHWQSIEDFVQFTWEWDMFSKFVFSRYFVCHILNFFLRCFGLFFTEIASCHKVHYPAYYLIPKVRGFCMAFFQGNVFFPLSLGSLLSCKMPEHMGPQLIILSPGTRNCTHNPDTRDRADRPNRGSNL